ncbi:hypothetical protein [Haloarcula vallismortis]|uniref:hypothetical protein n=1 Tax=Haloarcula vallismortis TaxID=28442 RepID=UPI000322D8EB|nr:hypothetical protein [Haloarcula vallismortis]
MFDLKRLEFSRVLDAHSDRYDKVDLAADRIKSLGGGQFAVERTEGDQGHVVELVEAVGHAWGQCDCDGFKYNDGPCSHLCGVWRAEHRGLVEIPRAKPEAISVEVRDGQQEIADHAAEPDVRAATDGGIRR